MNPYALPVCGALIGVLTTVQEHSTMIWLELSSSGPSSVTLTQVTLGGRFVVFVAVYGVLLGLAALVGRRGEPSATDRRVVLLTGSATAVFALVSTILIFWNLGNGTETELIVLIAVFGMAIGAGIQSAVVSFAGIFLGRRYR